MRRLSWNSPCRSETCRTRARPPPAPLASERISARRFQARTFPGPGRDARARAIALRQPAVPMAQPWENQPRHAWRLCNGGAAMSVGSLPLLYIKLGKLISNVRRCLAHLRHRLIQRHSGGLTSRTDERLHRSDISRQMYHQLSNNAEFLEYFFSFAHRNSITPHRVSRRELATRKSPPPQLTLPPGQRTTATHPAGTVRANTRIREPPPAQPLRTSVGSGLTLLRNPHGVKVALETRRARSRADR